jgi:hypothetical protein
MKTIKDAMNLQGRISAHFASLEDAAAPRTTNFMKEFSRLFSRMHSAICEDGGASWDQVAKLDWENTELGAAGKQACVDIENLWVEYEKAANA